MGGNPIFKHFSKQTSFSVSVILLQENAEVLKTNKKIFEILLGASQNRAHCVVALTCAFELACPHAFPRSCAFGAVRSLTAGLSAVTGEEDLSLVYPAVML